MTNSKIDKVLMVDDDPNIRLIAEMSLEGLTSWQVKTASSAKDALAAIEEEAPDLILLDMMMPDMDGITCYSQIKNLLGLNSPRVIFMTAKVQTQEVERYKALGAAGVITKPFDPMKLPDQIKDILNLA
jgi:CheY-like chemotaxis protein